MVIKTKTNTNPDLNKLSKEESAMTKLRPNPDPDNPANDNETPPWTRRCRPPPGERRARFRWRRSWTALNAVDTTSVARPFRTCRCCSSSVKATAPGCLGSSAPIPEDGSRWAVNPTDVQVGLDLLRRQQQGGRASMLVPVSQPMPDPTKLPDKGFPWQEQWAVNLKCLDGTDRRRRGHLQADDRRRHPEPSPA